MNNISSTLSWVLVSILGLEFIFSLILNLILLRLIKVVLGGRLRHPKLRHFLVSLLVANLLLTVVAIPAWIYVLAYDTSVEMDSPMTYKLSAIFYYTFDLFYGVLVLLHIVILMTERLYAIGWPIQHRIAADLPDYLTCAAVWFLAIVCSLIAVLVYLYHNFKELALVVSALCFPVLLMICFGLFAAILTKKNKSLSTEIRDKDFKLATIVALVAFSFAGFCLPLHVMNAVYHTCTTCNVPYFETILSLRCLQFSFAIVIDVIFMFGIDEFRSRVAWCIFKCCSINEHSENDLLHMDIPGVLLSNPSSSQCTLTRASKNGAHAKEQVELGFTNDQG